MASEWATARLDDVALVTDYVANGSFASLKENVQYKRARDYAVLVRTLDFNNSWNGDYVWVDERAFEFLRKSRLEPGDLVLSNVGSVGVVFRVPNLGQPMTLGPNAVMCRTRDKGRLDQRFLYFLFASGFGQETLRAITSGSVQAKFNKTDFRAVEVPLPPIVEQRAIAHILGALDDKIELNRRMNETLEALARALFKSWFVDFDPVRAKAEGRDTGLPPHIADLFPDSFEDSGLGEIPRGWSSGSVGDEFDITMGQSPPGETYNEEGEGVPFYQGRADFGVRFPTRRVYCTAPTRLASAGDTLVSVRAPVGDINMATERCAIGRGVAAVRHKSGSRSYSYQLMRWLEGAFAQFEAEGTVFGSIGKRSFHTLPCVVPSSEIVQAFESQLRVIDDRIRASEPESRSLTTLRDALLPKLISGELRVRCVAHTLWEATV